MSDWAVGDLAVCLDAPSCGDCYDDGPHDLVGQTLSVSDVISYSNNRHPALHFAGAAQLDWCACQFRKIRPDEHEACEEEFCTLLRRSRQTVRA